MMSTNSAGTNRNPDTPNAAGENTWNSEKQKNPVGIEAEWPNTTWPKQTILDEAARITSKDRNKDYGHPYENFNNIADLWNSYLDIKRRIHGPNFCLTCFDIANMNNLQKVARLARTPEHRDSVVDIAGYARTQEMISDYLRDLKALVPD